MRTTGGRATGVARRATIGAASGAAGTVALTGFRKGMERMGLVFETAPERVVARLQELRLLPDVKRPARRVLVLAAHYGYGTAAGTAAGWLRRRRESLVTEAAVGAALGVLVWGAGWTLWLPLLRVEGAPWTWHDSTVLLPLIDHAAFGAVWGTAYWALRVSLEKAVM